MCYFQNPLRVMISDLCKRQVLESILSPSRSFDSNLLYLVCRLKVSFSQSAMDSNICLFHAVKIRTMAFRGRIKPERWNRVLNQVDDMTHLAISQALGEGMFDYDFTWRTNSDIIGAFIGCLARDRIGKWKMFKLCSNLFDPIWCFGL